MIPKRLVFMCLFDMEMPDYGRENICQWSRLMPDYEIVIVRDLSEIEQPWRSQIMLSTNRGVQVDWARYAYLSRHGGYYADLDQAPVRSFEAMIPDDVSMVWGTTETDIVDHVASPEPSFFGCAPGHPLMREVVSRVDWRAGEGATKRTFAATGWGHLTRVLTEGLGIAAIPCHQTEATRVESPFERLLGNTLFLPVMAVSSCYSPRKIYRAVEQLWEIPCAISLHGCRGSWY